MSVFNYIACDSLNRRRIWLNLGFFGETGLILIFFILGFLFIFYDVGFGFVRCIA